MTPIGSPERVAASITTIINDTKPGTPATLVTGAILRIIALHLTALDRQNPPPTYSGTADRLRTYGTTLMDTPCA